MDNCRILISGGTTGIGRATAKKFLESGAKVFVFGRHEPELQDTLKELSPLGQIDGMVADQAETPDLKRVFEKATKALGGLDILVNNAAIGAHSAEEESLENIRYVIESNLIGLVQATKLALEAFEGRGQIINIGSMSDVAREKGSSVYVATKSAINGFTESLRKEVNEKGVRVVLIEPGLVGTDMSEQDVAEQREMIAKGEMLMAEDIAEAVYYAASQPERCDVVHMQVRPHHQSHI